MYRLVILLSFLGLMPKKLFSQNWEVQIKNIKSGKNNTTLFIYTSAPLAHPAKCEIKIRKKETFQYFYQQQFSIAPKIAQFSQSFHLGKGEYVYDIIISDSHTGNQSIIRTNFEATPQALDIYGSDILLSEKKITTLAEYSPLALTKTQKINKILYFYQEVYTTQPMLTARVILYKKNVKGRGNSAYLSLLQSNQILSLSQGKMIFTGVFELPDWETGNYLVETLYYADTQLMMEKNTGFTIMETAPYWNESEIETSIAKMKFIIPQQEIDKLLQLPNIQQKKTALENIWEGLYGKDGLKYANEYFARITLVEQLFCEDPVGWKSDRVSIWMKYGKPDEVRTFQTSKGMFEGWMYHKWNLSFVFKQMNQTYSLVK